MTDWYADGLCFSCTQCGNCCTGSPGYVWLSPQDQKDIPRYLGLTRGEFLKRYARLVGPHVALVDRPGGDCIFLTDDRRCSINTAKPRQCLTYPFWPRLLSDQREWNDETERCPGMGSGPRYTAEEIGAIMDRETPREVICKILKRERE